MTLYICIIKCIVVKLNNNKFTISPGGGVVMFYSLYLMRLSIYNTNHQIWRNERLHI